MARKKVTNPRPAASKTTVNRLQRHVNEIQVALDDIRVAHDRDLARLGKHLRNLYDSLAKAQRR